MAIVRVNLSRDLSSDVLLSNFEKSKFLALSTRRPTLPPLDLLLAQNELPFPNLLGCYQFERVSFSRWSLCCFENLLSGFSLLLYLKFLFICKLERLEFIKSSCLPSL